MSRNVRRKAAPGPAKAARPPQRRGSDSSSSLSLSDDEDGYSAVDDISDSSDDDEGDVDAAEEKNIVTEGVAKPVDAPRPQVTGDEDDTTNEEEEEEDDDDEEEEDDDDDDDAAMASDGDESTGWAGIVSEQENDLSEFYQDESHFASDIVVERHVRFDVPPSASGSDSDSTETEDDYDQLFPDIFVSQNSLDPNFRREIETDGDDSSASGTFWDHGQYVDQLDSEAEEVVRDVSDADTLRAGATHRHTSAAAPEFEQPHELDGYETDSDTDEEDVPEPPVRRKTRRPSIPMSEASDSDTESPVKSQRGQPRLGRFRLDRSDRKPIAVLNPLTRKMMIFTPHRLRQLDLSPEQFNLPWPMQEQSSPLLSNSANMMISAMLSSNTFGDFVNTQPIGPTEAFFAMSSAANGVDESSSPPSGLDDEEDAGEKKLDITDFIRWDDHSRDGDGGASSGDEGGEPGWDPESTPARPTTASSDMDVLSHLKPETVGAFRRNQINQQLLLSNQATQDSLAFSGPYNYTALRGLRSDRFGTAAAPLTPARRHKKHLSDLTRSPLESASAKRKASGDVSSQNGHKKQRSISDVNKLQI